MNEFYVDPYVDEDAPTARQTSRSQQKPPTRIIRAPAYSPGSNSPSSVVNRTQEVSSVSSSPSPRASRTRAETTRNRNSRDSRPVASSASSSGAMPVHASETPQPSTPFTSPPRRPPSAMSPRAADVFSSPQSPRVATSAESPRRAHTECSTDDGGSAPRASSSGTHGYGDNAATTTTNRHSSPSTHAVPTVPRTRGPGSRMLVPGTRQFDHHHRRNSIHITNAMNAAAAVEDEDGSTASGATVPSLFTTMHSRRKVRTDGPGSSVTMLSKTATRTRLSAGASPQGGGVPTESESEMEMLELPMQHYVAQSAYTMKNPFRTQDFAGFAANPSYAAPPDVATYSDVPTCDGGGLFAQQRASEGSFLIHRLADLTLPSNQADRDRLYAYLGRTLEVLQTGEWFLKWTRDNSVKQRFVWLNLQRGTLMWSSTAKQSLFDNSELKLSTVTDIRPDCIQDEQTGRVFYRMQIRTPDSWKTFATEIREKFDMWFQALVEVTRPNLTNGLPGVWGRPSEMVNTNGRGVPGRWTSRYSLLSAIAEGANQELRMSGAPVETRTSSGD